MAYEHKPNEGSLFVNDRKQLEKQPDYRGSINITKPGIYDLSGWKRTLDSGGVRLSLAARHIDDRPPKKEAKPEATSNSMDKVPF
jgi:hypothetical protein